MFASGSTHSAQLSGVDGTPVDPAEPLHQGDHQFLARRNQEQCDSADQQKMISNFLFLHTI